MNYDLVSTKPGKGWIAQVPRIDGTLPSDARQRVFAVQFSHVLIGSQVHVEIAALYQPGRTEVPVARFVLSPGAHVVVNELERFGIKPIMLSLTAVDAVATYLPTVLSASREVEISNVELLSVPYPAYRVSLRNLSNKSVASFEMQSYRGENKAISSSPRGQNGRAAMTPGESFTFTVNLAGGSSADITPLGHVSPQPLDVIEINFVRWEDGAVDGVSRFPGTAAQLPRDGGRRLQLARIIAVYKRMLSAAAPGAAVIRSTEQQIEALSDAEPDQLPEALASMGDMKRAALADIQRFTRDVAAANDAATVRAWMLAATHRYEDLLSRLAK